METRHLKIFTTVYRLKSFTKAAEQLYTSQPTISEHIQNLENELNCKLFDRLGRSIQPTPQADILYRGAKEILADLVELEESVTQSSGIVCGILEIGASTIPSTYLLPKKAAHFKQQHPNVSFEISVSDSRHIIRNVQDNELIMGVVGIRPNSAKLHCIPYAADEIVLAASTDVTTTPQITTQELRQLPLIQREKGSGTRESYEKFLAVCGIQLSKKQIAATLGSNAAIREAIKAGLGAGFISKLAIREELENGTIQEISLEIPKMKRQFFIITPAKRTLPDHYKLFSEMLQREEYMTAIKASAN